MTQYKRTGRTALPAISQGGGGEKIRRRKNKKKRKREQKRFAPRRPTRRPTRRNGRTRGFLIAAYRGGQLRGAGFCPIRQAAAGRAWAEQQRKDRVVDRPERDLDGPPVGAATGLFIWVVAARCCSSRVRALALVLVLVLVLLVPSTAGCVTSPPNQPTSRHKMLSLLYPKPSLPSSGTAKTEADDVPKIVDFNTIEQTAADDSTAGSAGRASGRGFLGLWPFGRAKSGDAAAAAAAANESVVSQSAVLDDAHDRVIAMKKIDSSVLHEGSSDGMRAEAADRLGGGDADADANDEDFIDIQLRQLSYAEVAALNLIGADHQFAAKKSGGRRDGARSVAAGGATGEENILVIDQEELLGKSITDMEMVDSFRNYEKFNPDLDRPCADGLSPEDQWDLYVEGKTPKKITRKKKSHKQKKTSSHS